MVRPRDFRKLEIARLQAEVAAQDREREAVDRREAAMAEARALHDEQARWDAFVQRSREWGELQQHREFLVAARQPASTWGTPLLTPVKLTWTSRSAGWTRSIH